MPEPAVNEITWLGTKYDPAKNNIYGFVRVERSTVPTNVGKTYRVRLGLPMAGMSEKANEIRTAEIKAAKFAFLPAEGQTEAAKQQLTAAAAPQLNVDFAGKRAFMWYEPGNLKAPDGHKARYDQQRWLSATVAAEAFAGTRSFKLQNVLTEAPSGVPSTIPGPANGAGAPVPMPAPAVAAPTVPTPPAAAAPSHQFNAPAADPSGGML